MRPADPPVQRRQPRRHLHRLQVLDYHREGNIVKGNLTVSIAQARHTVKAVADLDRSPVREGLGSPWLVDRITDMATHFVTGMRRCPHLKGPSVAIYYVWEPGVLRCPACAGARTRLSLVDDGTCDRCQRYAHTVTPGVVAVGPILLHYGLCRRCATETGLEPTGSAA